VLPLQNRCAGRPLQICAMAVTWKSGRAQDKLCSLSGVVIVGSLDYDVTDMKVGANIWATSMRATVSRNSSRSLMKVGDWECVNYYDGLVKERDVDIL
jgi:hypothetical protein